MNLQILYANIQNNKPYSFSFNDKVDQFFIGFSKFCIKYDTIYSHHVKEISIDLTDTVKDGNKVRIRPKIVMNDTSGNRESSRSSIEVVILASIGNGNQNVYLQSAVDTDERHNIPLHNINFMQTAIHSVSSKYQTKDHHLAEYSSHINITKPNSKCYKLTGCSIIRDEGEFFSNGQIKGSVIAYNGNNQDILCGYFTEDNMNSNNVKVELGDCPAGFQPNEYSFHCFISSFGFSYENGNDHHVMKIDLSTQNRNNELLVENNKICARLTLKAKIKDLKYHRTKLPHNKISGFVIAVRNLLNNRA